MAKVRTTGVDLRNKAYHCQKYDAKRRGIEFLLTFEEWVSWWEMELGPDWMKLRGSKLGRFVMARKGDKGPYKVGNIKCVSASENHAEMRENRTAMSGDRHFSAKLTADQVKEARALYRPYGAKGGMSGSALARKYGVCQTTMSECLRGLNWRHET